MAVLTWGGAALAVAGLFGLFWCILKVAGAKKAGLSDEEMRETLKKMVPLNMAALLLSVFGLMMVVMGIFLG
ncbi:hypothetical protein [Thalassovita mediterranea]|jgi:alkylhydroperoxidase/carboxymuconolactone decarboxylase family protein YurZ|uniref:Uncharacterized protein n=1 Tax=Thalassovita mediterranea TaxID=340021 RepID=A0A0P1GNI2_9RHOB|nr:hypothetical protein [Thalassovita mediterranea]MCG7574353.1 hypothetical protein [Phaeobacter sp. CNT1-3]CUH83760.1 hypothetical protein TM5383_00961 [Thalassovita mediterranea]SIS28506.1 hypothetical protein SAMN05421685_101553 [Thalassovita mediterranea]